ncbi:unnamed protein product [Alternaria alternata]|uniref:uncharacterized protein n=1 Tax=Alternaria postmessia TaxID=1187938 RepID=UPI002224E18E|nr:uncharacterized protein J4E82_009288 [Alternaria postmessia]KAI5372064.1 hypothetical protein J4E82_009288 [Alternaria postmessia]
MRSSSILVLGLAANTFAYAPQQVLSSLGLSGSSYQCDNGAKPSVVCNDASDKHNCSCTCTNGIKFDQPLDPFSSATNGGSSQVADNAVCQADKDRLAARITDLTKGQQDLLDQISTYQNTYHYQGCFTDADPHAIDTVITTDMQLTVEKCQTTCQAYRYFGINNGHHCHCGSKFTNPTKEINEADCNVPCDGNKSQTRCGGAWKLSVYAKPIANIV